MTLQELAYAMAFERLCNVFGLTHCPIVWLEVAK
jgi:hypothetical protein